MSDNLSSQRQLRFSELIRSLISQCLLVEDFYNFSFETTSITISYVKMSKDLRIANVYLMPLGGENKNKIIEEINNQKYIFQKFLSKARLNSKFDIRYGRIDVRAKLPKSKGTWPAIWTLGTNIGEIGNYYGTSQGNVGWPECGEIDIMEQDGTNKQLLYGTFHWADNGGQQASYGLIKDTSSLNISDLNSEFDLYSLIWNSSSIKVYVDNLLVSELDNTASVTFDNPHYLLLNMAMGGTLGGAIPGTF